MSFIYTAQKFHFLIEDFDQFDLVIRIIGFQCTKL